jgi:arylsulfatase A-like enzyme
MRRLAILCLALLAAPCLAAGPAAKPNIVVILADDLGRGDYSAFGTKEVQTPNIDSLCREGMTLDNFYSSSCVCSPTRAAFLTGCYPDRAGVPGVIRPNPDNSWGWLSPKRTLLPQVLKKQGYHTALVGKWHLGHEAPNLPTRRGFDHFQGFLTGMMDYHTHLNSFEVKGPPVNFLRKGEETINPKGHATDLFTDWACAYIDERAKKGGPFFLYLPFTAPHNPLQPKEEWLARVKKRQPSLPDNRAKLIALIEHMDDGIGKVLVALKRAGLEEKTLVVFTSDNGGMSVYGANNGPWRGGKQDMYEGGLRAPFAARWPGHIKAGSHSGWIALTMDLFPTLAEVAGGTAPKDIDGVSFLPTLLGKPQPEGRKEHYFVRREGGLRYGGLTTHALRRGDWKLVHNSPFGPAELFNLKDDPKETTDLSRKQRRVYTEMLRALSLHVQRGGQVPWQPPDRR